MNYRIVVRALLVVGLLLIADASLWAQNQSAAELLFRGNGLGVGARAIGMGGAYVGLADDYAAIFWNPAGMGQLRRMEFNVGFSHNQTENEALFLGNSLQNKRTFTRLNSLGFIFPVPTYRGSMVFGVGYNKYRDFDSIRRVEGFNEQYAAFQDYVAPYYDTFSENQVTRNVSQEITERHSGSLDEFTLAGAVEVQKDLMLGASLRFINGTDEFSKRFVEEDSRNLHNYISDEILSDLDYWKYLIDQETEISAVALKLGALYRIGTVFRLGATLTPPMTVKRKLIYTESQPEIYLDGGVELEPYEYESEYDFEVKEPYEISFGASAHLMNFVLSAGVDFRDWSQTKYEKVPYDGMQLQELNDYVADSLRATAALRLGAEVYIPLIRSRVRAGYLKQPSPFRQDEASAGDAYVYPDKEYFSAGISVPLGRQAFFDMALVTTKWDEMRFDPLAMVESEESQSNHKLLGTLSIRF
ncbi:MAG TPA: hypothetical protein PKN04_01755 [bacterium]|mgnify:CR=1 FL=1|nr:hypothetical protein [bacterium]HNT64484.1 hypothetical protein [bacterium]HOX84670.1 hypothetical protein [bacterium]HPG45393.1 hypothetical protein [bacterium]HPM96831.1 hypothetical protein [bacterium]